MDRLDPGPPADFYRAELEQAVGEQSFGILRGEVTKSTTEDAVAGITLLEGDDIEVILSSKGYLVIGRLKAPSAAYETLDALLGTVSQMYAAKRIETLMAKLQAIAE